MSITEAQRQHLYRTFEELVGEEDALVLLEALPPAGASALATKDDLRLLEARIDARFAAADGKFAAVDGKFDALRAEMHREMRDLQRNVVLATVTIQATFAGLVLAIVG